MRLVDEEQFRELFAVACAEQFHAFKRVARCLRKAQHHRHRGIRLAHHRAFKHVVFLLAQQHGKEPLARRLLQHEDTRAVERRVAGQSLHHERYVVCDIECIHNIILRLSRRVNELTSKQDKIQYI